MTATAATSLLIGECPDIDQTDHGGSELTQNARPSTNIVDALGQRQADENGGEKADCRGLEMKTAVHNENIAPASRAGKMSFAGSALARKSLVP